MTQTYPLDDPSDPEVFCFDCLAGVESAEHHEKCVLPNVEEA